MCLCCGQPTLETFDGLCLPCAGGVIRDGLGLRDVKDREMAVAWLVDHGCVTLAQLVRGPLNPDVGVGDE
jgi:hypothetical protein